MREIDKVARACGLDHFPYVKFLPLALSPAREPEPAPPVVGIDPTATTEFVAPERLDQGDAVCSLDAPILPSDNTASRYRLLTEAVQIADARVKSSQGCSRQPFKPQPAARSAISLARGR
jgi:hypothetical protein